MLKPFNLNVNDFRRQICCPEASKHCLQIKIKVTWRVLGWLNGTWYDKNNNRWRFKPVQMAVVKSCQFNENQKQVSFDYLVCDALLFTSLSFVNVLLSVLSINLFSWFEDVAIKTTQFFQLKSTWIKSILYRGQLYIKTALYDEHVYHWKILRVSLIKLEQDW